MGVQGLYTCQFWRPLAEHQHILLDFCKCCMLRCKGSLGLRDQPIVMSRNIRGISDIGGIRGIMNKNSSVEETVERVYEGI